MVTVAQAALFLLGVVVGYFVDGLVLGPGVLAVLVGVALGVGMAVAVGRYHRRRGVSF